MEMKKASEHLDEVPRPINIRLICYYYTKNVATNAKIA